MARIPQRFIDDLLDRVDIVDVVGSRIDLRKSGKNYSARCPFHEEKTPSFSVSPDKQFYYCFGCGAGGNALGFVMDHDHMGFVDSVETLAKQCGMEIPKESLPEAKTDSLRRKLYGVLTEADSYYRTQLRKHPEAKIAVDYLKKRGLSGEVAKTYGIGFAPPGWDNLINQLALDDDDVKLLIDAGMVIRKDDDSSRVYDRFRNRIIFPIRDTRGRTIGFGGRVLDDSKPKYLNSPETLVFHKGRELYGLFEAHRELREINSLMVVEGYMDVVALSQHGIHNAVATLGTAATSEHLEKLFRYASEVLFCFDGDKAGRTAARRALETSLPAMADGRSARFLFLPEGEDPDTLVRKLGRDAFENLMVSAQPLSEFLFSELTANIDTATPDGKARLSQQAAPMINRIPAGVFKQLMLKELARRTDMDIDVLTGIITPPEAQTLRPDEAPIDNIEPDDNYPEYAQNQAAEYYDYGQDHAPYPDQSKSSSRQQRRLKLSPLQRLVLLLLHNPSLRAEVETIENLEALDDPDTEVLINLCTLLDQNPHYTLNHILGYWRGVYGADNGEALARIVAADMVGGDNGKSPRDNLAEFRDICRHIQQRLEGNLTPYRQLEAILAKEEITLADRKRITMLQSQLTKEEKDVLYQQIKKSLTKQGK